RGPAVAVGEACPVWAAGAAFPLARGRINIASPATRSKTIAIRPRRAGTGSVPVARWFLGSAQFRRRTLPSLALAPVPMGNERNVLAKLRRGRRKRGRRVASAETPKACHGHVRVGRGTGSPTTIGV